MSPDSHAEAVFDRHIGARLRLARKSRRYTIAQAAARLGMSQAQYNKIEQGKRRLRIATIPLLAQIFNVRPGRLVDFLTDDTPPHKDAGLHYLEFEPWVHALINNDPTMRQALLSFARTSARFRQKTTQS